MVQEVMAFILLHLAAEKLPKAGGPISAARCGAVTARCDVAPQGRVGHWAGSVPPTGASALTLLQTANPSFQVADTDTGWFTGREQGWGEPALSRRRKQLCLVCRGAPCQQPLGAKCPALQSLVLGWK